jgi:hypothetical protein
MTSASDNPEYHLNVIREYAEDAKLGIPCFLGCLILANGFSNVHGTPFFLAAVAVPITTCALIETFDIARHYKSYTELAYPDTRLANQENICRSA